MAITHFFKDIWVENIDGENDLPLWDHVLLWFGVLANGQTLLGVKHTGDKLLERPTGRRYNIFISCDLLTGFQQPTSSSAYRSCLFFTNFFEALRSCLSFRCLFKARTQTLDLIPVQLVFSLNMTCKKEDTYSSVCSVESAGTISGSVFSSSAWQRRDSTLESKRRVRIIL